MGKSQWYIGAVNGVVLCVDSMQGTGFKSRVYHAYRRDAVKVSCIEQLLFVLDEFYDSIDFPYPSEGARIMSDEELLNRHGDLGTFIIRVQHRQNSSWQGRITWMDQDKTLSFRSMWEMIKLIASALDTVSEPEDGSENLEGKTWN